MTAGIHKAIVTLPADVLVERRGRGEERHVFLSIEGTSFELRADDAHAIGIALVHCAELIFGDKGGSA
jgi:hypothetical protein